MGGGVAPSGAKPERTQGPKLPPKAQKPIVPGIGISGPRDISLGETVRFEIHTETKNPKFSWKIDGEEGTGKIIQFKPDKAGQYTLVAKVTDQDSGLSNKITHVIKVFPQKK